jgi:uncharacterized protein YuzE
MNIKFDKVADAIYINMGAGKVFKTIEVDDSMVVDVDKNNKIVGVEFLNASSSFKNFEKSVKNGVSVEILSKTPAVA